METSNNNQETLNKLRAQLEYYLSDENLSRDKFFHDKISSDTQGYVDVDFFMNCNKIKQLGVNKEDVVKAAKLSSGIELDDKDTKVRRAQNKPLPDLKLLLNKKTKRERVESVDDEKDKENGKQENNSFDPVIYELTAEKENEISWKDVLEEVKTINSGINVVYLRFKGKDGHVGILKKSSDEPNLVESFELQGNKFFVKKCEGDKLISFWKDHGSHFEMCVGRQKRKGGKNDRKGKFNETQTALKNSIKLGDEVYNIIFNILI